MSTVANFFGSHPYYVKQVGSSYEVVNRLNDRTAFYGPNQERARFPSFEQAEHWAAAWNAVETGRCALCFQPFDQYRKHPSYRWICTRKHSWQLLLSSEGE